MLRGLSPRAIQRTAGDLLPAGGNPRAVLLDEGSERLLGGGAFGQLSQRLHGKLDSRHGRRLRLLHLGGPDPDRAQLPARPVHQSPRGGHAVAGRILRGIGVVQIGHLLIPLRRVRAAQVGPRHEPVVRFHFDLGLKGVRAVRLLAVGGAAVDEEARYGARAGGQQRAGQVGGENRPLDHVELEAARVGDGVRRRLRRAPQRYGQRLLVYRTRFLGHTFALRGMA